MKLSSFVLTASLLANATLVAVLAFGSADSPPGSVFSRHSAGASAAGFPADATAAAGKSSAAGTAAATHKSWDRLRTDDLAALVTRLREAGFPPTAIRRIIGTLVSELFDARRYEIEKASLESPFWANTPNSNLDSKIGPELRKLQREQTEMLQRLLGGNLNDLFADTAENKALLRLQIGNVPPDKVDQLYATFMDYSERLSQTYAAANGGRAMLDADREKLAAIQKGLRDDLGKFLTPADTSEVMMRMSQTGSQLISLLAPFRPSEAEYRTIYPIYQALMDQYPTLNVGTTPADLPPEQRMALDQAKNQIVAQLGPDRAADFMQASNPAYSQLNRLVARLDLPLSAATQVATVQQETQQEVAAVRADPNVKGAARRAEVAALATDATNKISTALGGARGLDAYKQYGGQWLVNLTPPPRPTPAAPKN